MGPAQLRSRTTRPNQDSPDCTREERKRPTSFHRIRPSVLVGTYKLDLFRPCVTVLNSLATVLWFTVEVFKRFGRFAVHSAPVAAPKTPHPALTR